METVMNALELANHFQDGVGNFASRGEQARTRRFVDSAMRDVQRENDKFKQCHLSEQIRLANCGHPQAQTNLGISFLTGHAPGNNMYWDVRDGSATLSVDYARAKYWLEKASAQGYGDADNELGIMHEHGLGMPKDIPSAVRCYERGVQRNSNCAKAALGRLKFYGRGVTQDIPGSIRLFEASAKEVPLSSNMMGALHLNGMIVNKDHEKAREYFKMAAAKHYAKAHVGLGSISENIDKDLGAAIQHYKLAGQIPEALAALRRLGQG